MTVKSRAAIVGLAIVLCGAGVALAQAPLGMAHNHADDGGGLVGWILVQQAGFYRMLSGGVRAAKADGSAAYALLGISFLYGVFHAAGPGHGKAVISSYLVANDETWKRGVVLSFASAILQAFTAIAIVGIMAVLLGQTAKAMSNAVRVIEIFSYALIILIGLRLLWVKGRAFVRLLLPQKEAHAHHDHSHHHHDHATCGHDHHGHSHGHDHAHEHDASAWSHAHAPEPADLGGRHWLRRGLSAVVAVGLRPCSGAIIVLVFALSQGIFWLGVASTFAMGLGTALTVTGIAVIAVGARQFAGKLAKGKSGAGMLIVRGLETAASLVIIAFGTLLLAGYMASERLL